jgi:hypothetical protein
MPGVCGARCVPEGQQGPSRRCERACGHNLGQGVQLVSVSVLPIALECTTFNDASGRRLQFPLDTRQAKTGEIEHGLAESLAVQRLIERPGCLEQGVTLHRF